MPPPGCADSFDQQFTIRHPNSSTSLQAADAHRLIPVASITPRIKAETSTPGGPPPHGNTTTRSSGSSSETVPDDSKLKKAVGALALPNAAVSLPNPWDRHLQSNAKQGGPSSATAQSARALAISSALAAQHARPSAPIRSESPRIPSGGVDAVAAKATTTLREHGARLELDENSDCGVEVAGFNGFSSARGMKRNISGEDRA